jgi:hypothetical protein
MRTTTLLMLLLVATLSNPATAEETEVTESPLVLPADLQWCESLESVATKLAISDTSETGHAYRADGEYLVTGVMWNHKGNYTVRFEEWGSQATLVEVEFRMFREAAAWEDVVSELNKMLGAGTSETVANAQFGPDGEELAAQRSKHTYDDPTGDWEVFARQMSNEIDAVKFSYTIDLCRPEGWAPGQVEYDVQAPAQSEKRGDDIFNFDQWADDPLHADTREAELEEERKREEEEKKAEEEEQAEGEIDWADVGKSDEDEDVEW